MENKNVNKVEVAENTEIEAIFDIEDIKGYKNIDGKLEEVKKAGREELVSMTFRIKSKSAERFNYLYAQQSDKNKSEFASDIIDNFFKWFAVDECVTKEDLQAKDEEIKALKKELSELKKNKVKKEKGE